jgi:phosphate transport system protein
LIIAIFPASARGGSAPRRSASHGRHRRRADLEQSRPRPSGFSPGGEFGVSPERYGSSAAEYQVGAVSVIAPSHGGGNMTTMTIPPHTSKDFDAELAALAARLVAMGARAEHQTVLAMRAVTERDDHLADEVITGDAAINQDEKEIDEQALQLMGRRQPVAGDLRFVTMCLKAVTDLERIGDLAVNSAQRARELNRLLVPPQHLDLERRAALLARVLRAALASLVNKDADAAERVIQETVELERGQANVLAELLAHVATDPAAITWVLPLTSVCRYLDRMGDHVRSLAGEVIYMVRAEHMRHPAV